MIVGHERQRQKLNRIFGDTVVELFAGAGGFSWGWSRVGLPPRIAVDNDVVAIRTHELNFPATTAIAEDLYGFGPADLRLHLRVGGKVLAVIGGPPCQGFSTVGRAKLRSLRGAAESLLNDPRNSLYKRYVDFVDALQPAVFVMENVPGMRRIEGEDISAAIVENFEAIGYRTTSALVNARDFGVPQDRRRVIFIGTRAKLNLDIRAAGLLEYAHRFREQRLGIIEDTNVRQAIADLPEIPHGTRSGTPPYKTGRASRYAELMRQDAERIVHDHVCRWHNDQDLTAFEVMPEGGIYAELPQELKRYRDDIFKDKYKKLTWEKASGTVTAHLSKDCYSHIHPEQIRTISVREAARLQSFPDNFRFAGSMGAQFRQIGNAVPPLMGWGIAEYVLDHLRAAVKSKSRKRLALTR
jgi:DNA (cytosine-5)-methyltransferase 1